jgi:hypothetical protein
MLRGNWKAKEEGRQAPGRFLSATRLNQGSQNASSLNFRDCDYDIRKFVIVFGSPSGTQGGELVQESSSRL